MRSRRSARPRATAGIGPRSCTPTRRTTSRAAGRRVGRRIIARISRKRIDSSETLGRYRWVIERTHAWLNQYRRLIIRYERQVAHYAAFTSLACALICWNYLTRWF